MNRFLTAPDPESAAEEETPEAWPANGPSGLTPFLDLGSGWSLLADYDGNAYLSADGEGAVRLDFGPPLSPSWLKLIAAWLETHIHPRRPRPPRHVERAAYGAQFSWTTDLRIVIITHACGHLCEHRIREAELESRTREYAGWRCPGCMAWDGNSPWD